jgi:hypothetical protein
MNNMAPAGLRPKLSPTRWRGRNDSADAVAIAMGSDDLQDGSRHKACVMRKAWRKSRSDSGNKGLVACGIPDLLRRWHGVETKPHASAHAIDKPVDIAGWQIGEQGAQNGLGGV